MLFLILADHRGKKTEFTPIAIYAKNSSNGF